MCASLWMNYSLNPDGSIGLCCANKTRINQTDRLQIKQKMLLGEEISGCNVCYVEENLGKTSLRQRYNNLYSSYKNNIFDLNYENISHYDLSMSNKCNQKCRMCGPEFSTAWFKDAIELKEHHNFDLPIRWSHMIDGSGKYHDHLPEVDEIVEHMQRASGPITIKLKGGEPLFINANTVLLEKIIKLNLHTKTTALEITTNGIQYDKEIINLIKCFPNRVFHISIDATGKLYEYIRGSNVEWNECIEKWKFLQSISNKLTVNNTLMIYNAYDYQNLKKFVNTHLKGANLNNNLLFSPKYLSVKILNDELRFNLADAQYQKSSLYGFIRETVKPSDFSSDENLDILLPRIKEKFKNYTLALDQLRNESLVNVAPELSFLLD